MQTSCNFSIGSPEINVFIKFSSFAFKDPDSTISLFILESGSFIIVPISELTIHIDIALNKAKNIDAIKDITIQNEYFLQ